MNSGNHHEHGRHLQVGPHPALSSNVFSRMRIALGTAGARLKASLRASAWTAVAVRVGSLAVALVLLAWIGRTATTAQAGVVAAGADGRADAGAVASATRPVASTLIASTGPIIPTSGSSASASPADRERDQATSHARATASDPVFVNHASAEELRRLPGVGPKRAEAIVALRQRVGRFQRVEDLLRVKGVGRATLRKWRPLVRLDAPTSPSSDAGRP
jgi:competence protein ComEA